MKKFAKVFALSLIVILSMIPLCACTSAGVRYNLIDVDFGGLASVAQYEYNYIEFDFDKGTYKVENKVKANGIVTRQTGNFYIYGDHVTITNNEVPTQNYLLCAGEQAYFVGDTFYVEGTISGFGAVSMTFQK